ncbi:transcriptional regulator [Staphylococcus aureus]|uniref:Transcriptional regulator n=1 Tax=Staphylococcus aureus TaxID=1280 RepID=A0A380DWB4_STAAU|nr:transcriptional regulator [Staphylococcus aureus]
MVKICNDGFDENFIEEHRNLYSIAYTQNVLSGRYKNLIIWYLKQRENDLVKLRIFRKYISRITNKTA